MCIRDSFYSDRGSHYWHTPEAGGKVDKQRPTQFGHALQRLGTVAADRVAMIVEDDGLGTSAITYRELAARTDRFAQLLRDLGIAAGERVLIRLPNSIDYPTAFLGAMKRGAVSVPTSTLLTAEEVEYLAHDSGAHVIVIDKAAWNAMGPKLAGKESLAYALLSGAGQVTQFPGVKAIDLEAALAALSLIHI